MSPPRILAYTPCNVCLCGGFFACYQDELTNYVVNGQLKVSAVQEYEFTEGGVAKAHADIESGNTVGKLILVP